MDTYRKGPGRRIQVPPPFALSGGTTLYPALQGGFPTLNCHATPLPVTRLHTAGEAAHIPRRCTVTDVLHVQYREQVGSVSELKLL